MCICYDEKTKFKTILLANKRYLAAEKKCDYCWHGIYAASSTWNAQLNDTVNKYYSETRQKRKVKQNRNIIRKTGASVLINPKKKVTQIPKFSHFHHQPITNDHRNATINISEEFTKYESQKKCGESNQYHLKFSTSKQ